MREETKILMEQEALALETFISKSLNMYPYELIKNLSLERRSYMEGSCWVTRWKIILLKEVVPE